MYKRQQSKEEFKVACDKHVDTKLQLTVQKAKYRKEIQKIQRALNTMVKTQQTLALELEKNANVRKQIQMSGHYNPKVAANKSNTASSTVTSASLKVYKLLIGIRSRYILKQFSYPPMQILPCLYITVKCKVRIMHSRTLGHRNAPA